jgi:D-alanyl-D-alanine carboxypeptidase
VRTRITKELLEAGLAGANAPIGNIRTLKADIPTAATDLRRLKCGRQGPVVAGTTVAGGDVRRTAVPKSRD